MKIEKHDINNVPDPGMPNMENFGELQYIIDRLPAEEQFVLREYFIHGTAKVKIARLINRSAKVVDRILQNLARINLTNGEPTITFRKKTFALRGLNECNY